MGDIGQVLIIVYLELLMKLESNNILMSSCVLKAKKAGKMSRILKQILFDGLDVGRITLIMFMFTQRRIV